MRKIEVNRELLEKCIKDIDVADLGNDVGKLSIKFNDDVSEEEVEAIKEFFNNMYHNLATYLGISDEELTRICEKFDQISDEIAEMDEDEAKKIVADVLKGISNEDATLTKKLKELDNVPEPSNEELDEIEDENKIIDLTAYRKKRF